MQANPARPKTLHFIDSPRKVFYPIDFEREFCPLRVIPESERGERYYGPHGKLLQLKVSGK